MHNRLKVLLIDDDIELVSTLEKYLVQDGFDVRAVYEGESGQYEALAGNFAIVVWDIMQPNFNGIDELRRFRMESQMPIIVLTSEGDEMDRIIGLELGADDYVHKPCSPRELAARIRAILRRMQPSSNGQAVEVGNLKMWPTRRRAELDGRFIDLTSTEFNLLKVLIENAGYPVGKESLSEYGLGRQMEHLDRSIDVHISKIRQKIGKLPDGRSYIQTVYRQGYQFIRE